MKWLYNNFFIWENDRAKIGNECHEVIFVADCASQIYQEKSTDKYTFTQSGYSEPIHGILNSIDQPIEKVKGSYAYIIQGWCRG